MSFYVRLVGALLAVAAVAGGAYLGFAAGRQQSGPVATVPDAPPAPSDTGRRIAALQALAAAQPDSGRVQTALGLAYLQQARETGDPSHYPRAEAALGRAVALEPGDVDALLGLGTLALARHQFALALDYGERARALNPYKAAVYGVIGDALVELGRYDEARVAVQTMVDTRPDLASYSRVSYLRELYGDLPGAIAAMQAAVEAGAPGTEAAAWTRVQLANLLLTTGRVEAAEREYRRAGAEYPDYIHARAGLARVQAARGDLATAIATYETITRELPLPEFAIALADLHHVSGNAEAAARADALVAVMDRLQQENGVVTDVEIALFAADRGEAPAETVERARHALDSRPGIHAWDAYAWALFQAGALDEAHAAIEQALRLGSRDGLIRYHAARIALALGHEDEARGHLRLAVRETPHFSLRHAGDAAVLLGRLDARAGKR
jgi:tetratricopeptide (TPR) repeat protein